MEIIKVKLTGLKLADDNVRMHPRNQIAEYKRSLEMFGQTKNAVIDGDGNVLIGNGLVIAARELGWDEIAAVRRTDLSENAKLKLMVSDNKVYGLGVDNLDAIDEIFQRLAGDLDIPGYDEATLQTMVAGVEAVTESLISYGTLNVEEIDEFKRRTPLEPAAGGGNTNGAVIAEKNGGAEETAAEDKIPFKCPNCGEDIWLSKDALRQLLS